MFKKYSVYIIGHIPADKSNEWRAKFSQAQRVLENCGFQNVTNPYDLEAFKNEMPMTERKRRNFIKLMNSNAVYILPNVPLATIESIELKIARDLDMLIIHDLYFIKSNLFSE